VANFVSDGVDLGIRVGRGNWSGLQSQRLTTERLCVVCTPEFAGRHRVNSVRDLAAVPLVHDLDRLWPLLFEPHGLMSPPPGNLVSNSTLLTVDAILRGLGAAILRYSMVEDDLRTGRLIRPVPDVLPLPLNFIKPGKLVSAVKPDAPTPPDLGYFAVWRAENRKRRRIEAIVNWLEQEAASSEEWLGQQIKDSGRRSHRVRRGKSARDSTVVRA
jgi:LysR family glycine cleavage system transcriptional activator